MCAAVPITRSTIVSSLNRPVRTCSASRHEPQYSMQLRSPFCAFITNASSAAISLSVTIRFGRRAILRGAGFNLASSHARQRQVGIGVPTLRLDMLEIEIEHDKLFADRNADQ